MLRGWEITTGGRQIAKECSAANILCTTVRLDNGRGCTDVPHDADDQVEDEMKQIGEGPATLPAAIDADTQQGCNLKGSGADII